MVAGQQEAEIWQMNHRLPEPKRAEPKQTIIHTQISKQIGEMRKAHALIPSKFRADACDYMRHVFNWMGREMVLRNRDGNWDEFQQIASNSHGADDFRCTASSASFPERPYLSEVISGRNLRIPRPQSKQSLPWQKSRDSMPIDALFADFADHWTMGSNDDRSSLTARP